MLIGATEKKLPLSLECNSVSVSLSLSVSVSVSLSLSLSLSFSLSLSPGALLRPCSERDAATAQQEWHGSRVHPGRCQDSPTRALTELQTGDAARLTPQERQQCRMLAFPLMAGGYVAPPIPGDVNTPGFISLAIFFPYDP